MKSFLWPRFSYGITKLFYVLLRLLATIVMLLHQWILSVFLFFFSKTNCRTSYPQGRRRRTNMPSTTMNRISEFFFPSSFPSSTIQFPLDILTVVSWCQEDFTLQIPYENCGVGKNMVDEKTTHFLRVLKRTQCLKIIQKSLNNDKYLFLNFRAKNQYKKLESWWFDYLVCFVNCVIYSYIFWFLFVNFRSRIWSQIKLFHLLTLHKQRLGCHDLVLFATI